MEGGPVSNIYRNSGGRFKLTQIPLLFYFLFIKKKRLRSVNHFHVILPFGILNLNRKNLGLQYVVVLIKKAFGWVLIWLKIIMPTCMGVLKNSQSQALSMIYYNVWQSRVRSELLLDVVCVNYSMKEINFGSAKLNCLHMALRLKMYCITVWVAIPQ